MSDEQHVHVMELIDVPAPLAPCIDWELLGEVIVKVMDLAAARKLAELGSGSVA